MTFAFLLRIEAFFTNMNFSTSIFLSPDLICMLLSHNRGKASLLGYGTYCHVHYFTLHLSFVKLRTLTDTKSNEKSAKGYLVELF
jgi:hypothetical protein